MSNRTSRKKLIYGAVAAAALVGGGAAVASSQFGSSANQQAIINDAASRLGVQPSQLSDALKKAYEARIDAAVTAGQLSKADGDALKAQIEAGNLPLVGGDGFDHHGPGFGDHHPGGLAGAATYLGLTEDALHTKLEAGATLAQIATDQNKTVDGLKQAILDAAKADLDADVTAGRFTAADEQRILSDLTGRLDDLVNGKLGPDSDHDRGSFGHRDRPDGASGGGNGLSGTSF